MPVVKCPRCGLEVEFHGNEYRPFCSERCKLLDFGAWADEEFSIPSGSDSPNEEEIEAIVRTLKEGSK